MQPVVGGSGRSPPIGTRRSLRRHVRVRACAAEDDQVLISAQDSRVRTIDRNRLRTNCAWRSANELDVFFQPQVDLRTNRCARSTGPVDTRRRQHRAARPAGIRLRTRTDEPAHSVRSEHCAASRDDPAQGLELGSINLSTRHSPIDLPDLMHTLDTWATSDPADARIKSAIATAPAIHDRIRDQGCKAALDDFGTGYCRSHTCASSRSAN
jgi:EAL domain-containing protein (putative c-di-GMP-specific phosphodiesterase class I)